MIIRRLQSTLLTIIFAEHNLKQRYLMANTDFEGVTGEMFNEYLDREKIEEAAVRAVAAFIDTECSGLKSRIASNDKTPIWDGEIFLYKDKKKHRTVDNFFAKVPVQIKGTTNTKDDYYRIERVYLEGYQADRGCLFFLVQEGESLKPQRILYALLSTEIIDRLLKQGTKTIRIDLKEIPKAHHDFEDELKLFARERSGEKIENPATKEIESLLKKFEDIDTEKINIKSARYALESFLKTIKELKYDKTIAWRDRFVYLSLEIVESAVKNIEEYDFSDLQFELGRYLYKQKLYHLVEVYFIKSLAKKRELAEENPDAHLGNVASILNNLADLHSRLDRYAEAEKEYKEALDVRRALANANPGMYLRDVSETLNNLAGLHCKLNCYVEAEKEYKDALGVRRELAKNDPDAYLGYVAGTLNNLGVLHRDLNRYCEAEGEFKEALVIRRGLAKANPGAYQSDVAATLN